MCKQARAHILFRSGELRKIFVWKKYLTSEFPRWVSTSSCYLGNFMEMHFVF